MNPPDIQTLHSAYCSLTGFDLSMRYDRERAWYEFIKAGFTAEDLRMVILHLKAGVHRKERHSGCLKFSNLIECLNYFEEDLAVARAKARIQAKTDRDAVIEIFRPVVCEAQLSVRCKPVHDIVPKLIDAMRKAAR